MALERFNAGEELSARKLNGLVCALNNLCSSARNLQRDQTFSLGNNDRPRRFWDNTVNCGCATCFTAGVEYRNIGLYLPPFAVLKIGDSIYVRCGMWKTGNKEYVKMGGWFNSPAATYRYVYATHTGKIIIADKGCNYDWRFYQLLADLGDWCAQDVRMNICEQMVCVSFPTQFWVGDIYRPAPRWSQGGVFASCLRQCARLHICGGFAYVESPLAIAGKRSMCMSSQKVNVEECTLTVVSGYYPVPAITVNIPAVEEDFERILMLHYKHTAKKGFTGSAGEFTWYWTAAIACNAVPTVNCDTARFSYSVSSTSELEICGGSYGKCMIGSGTPTNYTYDGGGNWGLAVPMGRAFIGADGIVCARISQKIPEFRGRPIINLWNARVCLGNPPCVDCSQIGSEYTTICRYSELRSQSREGTPIVSAPRRIEIQYGCDEEQTASMVYKTRKQNTISETYYTNGNG